MALNSTQLQTLKAAIAAETDPTFVLCRANGQTTLMAAWFNGQRTPIAKAWNSAVDPITSDQVTPWPAFDSLTAGKRDSWKQFFAFPRDYSKGVIRKWITDVWGAATAASSAETILTAGLRNITRAESVLGGSATATTGTVTALRLDWEGDISDSDISAALGA